MSRVAALLAHDVRLQFRYGIYAAYAVVVALYAALLASAGPALPTWVAPLLIFIDPAGVGFIFLGALMLLERSEGVRAALAASPVRAIDYLAAKLVTLTALALAASVVLMLIGHHPFDAMLVLATVTLTSLMYVAIGVLFARRFATVNGYLIGAGAVLTPLIVPGFLAFLEPFPALLLAWPAVAQLRLMLVGLGAASATPVEIALMLAVCAIAALAAIWVAHRDLRREFGK
jgi:fluoroquinolone transport system permease protein